jgi:hypothetical protein
LCFNKLKYFYYMRVLVRDVFWCGTSVIDSLSIPQVFLPSLGRPAYVTPNTSKVQPLPKIKIA